MGPPRSEKTAEEAHPHARTGNASSFGPLLHPRKAKSRKPSSSAQRLRSTEHPGVRTCQGALGIKDVSFEGDRTHVDAVVEGDEAGLFECCAQNTDPHASQHQAPVVTRRSTRLALLSMPINRFQLAP